MDFINGISFDFYNVSALIAVLGSFVLGLISLLKKPINKLSITISLFNFMVAVWILVLLLLRVVKDLQTANAIVKYFSPFMFLLPVVFLRFTIIFTKTETKMYKMIFWGLFCLSVAPVIMTFLEIGTKSLYYKTDGNYFVAQPDITYLILNYDLVIGALAGLYLLIKKFISPGMPPIERKQVQYLFVAFTIIALLAATNQLDVFGLKIPPLAVFGAFIYMLIMTYAVFTYDLLQAKEVLARIITFGIVALGFSAPAVILLSVLDSIRELSARILIGLPVMALIVFFVNWLDKTLNKLTGRVLFKGIDFGAVLDVMRKETESTAQISSVLGEINGIVSKALQIKSLNFIIRHGRESNFIDEKNRINLPETSPLIKLLRDKKERVYFEELNNQLYYSIAGEKEMNSIREILEVFRTLDAEICLPVFIRNDLRGVWFIGGKKSRNIFSREEMAFLNNTLYLLAARMENIMLYEQLLGSERLTMLGQMAAAVAHEIRNPLTGLSGFIQMINEGGERSKKLIDRFFQIAPGEFKRLEKLTDNLLALSHTTRLTLAPENINDLLSEVVEFMSYILKKKKVEAVVQKGTVPLVKIDREQIRQTVLNLLINAVQAMQDGGKIVFSTDVQKRENMDYVFISIKDSGSGVDPAIAERIFDPFYTTKADGSGLGLPISLNIMQAHRGFIEFDTKMDEGSCFYLFFPADK